MSKKKELQQKFKSKVMPLTRLIPNLTTLVGLCMGLSAIRLALNSEWERSLWLILLAMVIDGLDGRIARFLGASSRFGAELDSLSDFVNFGVTPGLIIYTYSLHSWRAIGWAFVLFFCVCSALRLARFNTMDIEGMEVEKPTPKAYFTGVPMPAGALLMLIPLMVSIHFNYVLPDFIFMLNTAVVATLLVSQLPTFSFKTIKLEPKFVRLVMLGVAIAVGLLISYPWLVISLAGVAYYVSFYYSWRAYARGPK